MIFLALGLAVLAVVDTAVRFSGVVPPGWTLRAGTVALSLGAAYLWARPDWILMGLAGAGTEIVIVTAFPGPPPGPLLPRPVRRQPVRPVRAPSPAIGRRVPDLP